MGLCREEESEEEGAESAAASWPWFAWWVGLERRAIPYQALFD